MGVFGSWEAIVESSAEPVEALASGGIAVLNADDPVAAGTAERCAGRVVTFGLSEEATVRAEAVSLDDDGLASFELVRGADRSRVTLGVPGVHMVSNALAAAAAGAELGVPIESAASALGGAGVTRWRMESFLAAGGVRVLNDAYNASPESMAAALKTARWMSRGSRLIAVVGAMAELGPISAHEHERVGELAARLGVDRLIAVGAGAGGIALAAVREGLPPDDVAHYEDPDAALEDVRRHAGAGDVVLFKASRVVGLERLAEAMR
jgi:UDP-N-acetylmuramoyl-tripeptide--D-alanyl-D-alanine ligase